jgi:hydroxyacylglutathione hydrolase
MPKISPITAFNDNYIWLLRAPDAPLASVVDPGDAAPVIARLEAEGLRLTDILITHHHGDHVGGVMALLARWPQARVHGPAGERIPACRHPLREGDQVTPEGLSLTLRVLDVPGHTAGHIAYYGDGVLFCGDTLFAGGCGRLFEGTAAQMHASLAKLAGLPAQTLVHCAHEYTEANLRFAGLVEPGNPALLARISAVAALRAAGQPSVPSRLADELATNPFLRSEQSSVRRAAEQHAGHPLGGPVAVFAAIRRWKDAA